jgi:hypothetical protein
MPGGLMDDRDMRWGFAIDRAYRVRSSVVRRCACGAAIGMGWNAREECYACKGRRERAKRSGARG